MTAAAGPRGVRIHVGPSGDAPLVLVEVAIGGGAAADPVGVEGLHRHAALLARRGAGVRDRTAFDDALDGLGASLEVSVGRDSVVLSGLALTRNLDALIDLVADALAAPRMSDDEHLRLLRETPQVLDEIRDDDGALATRWFDHRCAPGHPYGRTALGTETSLTRITRADAARLWHAEAVAPNLVIGIAGDVDEDRALRVATRLTERLPDAPAPPPPALDHLPSPAGRHLIVVDKPERTQAQLRLGHLGPRWGHDDTAALLVVEAVFGGMFSSRLMQEIRVKRGWSYGAGCAMRRSRGPHWIEMWMATAIEVAGDATRLTLDLYADLAEHGVTDDELDFARSYLVGAMPFHLATARQRMQLAVRDEVFGLPAGYTASMPARLGALGPGDVLAAGRRHLRPDDVVTVAVTTAAVAADALAKAGAGQLSIVAHDAY